KLPQLREPATFFGWIKKICIHICYRSLQKNRFNNTVDNIPLESDTWWENELDEKLDSLSRRAHLFEILAKLPQTLRSTLLLRYYTNYQSYDAIARILCIPVGTVRSRLNQAKLKMSEHWNRGREVNEKYFYEAEDWNRFYLENVGNSHYSLSARDKFLNHLNTDIKFVFTSGKTDYGRQVIEHQIEEDLMHGSYFGEINAISNGNISVVEALNINSVEYPDRCPESTILVMYRTGKKATQVNLHNSTPPV
ncbi:MAG TPA: RNA polymerase sigma factor, partial [Agriterribacter sp.]|nr:RNA polymerase sigma factor [Agriterribacter sp.]